MNIFFLTFFGVETFPWAIMDHTRKSMIDWTFYHGQNQNTHQGFLLLTSIKLKVQLHHLLSLIDKANFGSGFLINTNIKIIAPSFLSFSRLMRSLLCLPVTFTSATYSGVGIRVRLAAFDCSLFLSGVTLIGTFGDVHIHELHWNQKLMERTYILFGKS